MVSLRILQLGGTPIPEPKDWYRHTNCAYEAPTEPHVRTILDQNIRGEQCAIGVYRKLLDLTREKDPVTYNLALGILSDEVEHEEDLQGLLEDYEILVQTARK